MSAQFVSALSWNWAFWSALTIYSLACTGAGLLVLGLVRGTRTVGDGPHAVFLALASILGLGLLGQLWVLLALAGFLIRPAVYPAVGAMVAAAAVLGWRHARMLAREWRETRLALRRERLGVRVLLPVALAWLVGTFAALGRPFSSDSLALHMMIPKAAAASGMLERNWFQPGNEYFGLLGEMTYAVLMQLGNADAAQMSTWLVVFPMSAVLLGVCQRVGIGVRGRIVALTALASTTAVLTWIGEGKVDLLATALGLAALYLLVPRADLAPLPRADLVIAGLLAGCAITAKLMLGFCLAVASGILIFWTYAPAALRSRRPWQGLNVRSLVPLVAAGALFGAFVVIGLVPHFIKNALLLDAPFAPLGTGGTSWLVRERWYDSDTVMHIRLLYPFVLTFGEYFAQYGQLSVLVLAFLPLALFMRRPVTFWRSPLTAITVAAWAAIAGWAAFQGDKVVMRYILPVLLLCIPVAAAAAEHVTARWFRPRILGTGVIAACFATLCITASFSAGFYFFPAQATRVAFGTAQPCERGLQWCAPMQMVNRLAWEGARVLSFSNFKYYLRADLIQCSYDNRTVAFPGSTEDERWRWFYAQGYSFILPDPPGNTSHLFHDLANPPPWIKVNRYQPDNPTGPILISYDLAQGGPTVPPDVACRRTRRDAWKVVRTGA